MAARFPMRLLRIVPARGWSTGIACRQPNLQVVRTSHRLYHQTTPLRNDSSTPQTDSDPPSPRSPPLLANLKSDLKSAMRSKDAPRLAVLRSIISATNNASKTENPIVTDPQLVSLLRKTKRASDEAVRQFRQAGRDDLAEKEEAQAVIMEEYINRSGLASMGEAELRRIVDEAVANAKSAGVAARGLTGEVMKVAIAAVEGKDIDKKVLNKMVKEAIAKLS